MWTIEIEDDAYAGWNEELSIEDRLNDAWLESLAENGFIASPWAWS